MNARSRQLAIGGIILSVGLMVILFIYNRDAEVEAQRPKLSIMLKMGDSFQSIDNQYIAELERIFDIQLEIATVPASSYEERVKVLMASGTPPDIVQINWSGESEFSYWAENGNILPIDLERAPNIKFNTPSHLIALMKAGNDQKVYGVPGVTTSYPYGVIIRKDWLDRLGLPEPRTLEEYETVLHAFTEWDPNGNRKKDTFGITSYRLNEFGGVFGGAFQIDYLWNSLHPDVSSPERPVVFREEQKGYLDFIRFARKAYENGWLDPDFVNLDNAEHKFILGKVGMIGGYSYQTLQLEKELRRFVPEARLEWILGPADHQGRHWNFRPDAYGYKGIGSMMGNNAVFVITNEKNYDLALRFLDMMNSREMILFSNLGLKGVHYEEYDPHRNILSRTAAQNERAKKELFGISDTYRGESLINIGDNAEENDRLEYYRKKGHLLITNPTSYSMSLVPEAVRFYRNHPGFKEKERMMAIQYVIGGLEWEQYVAYLQEENWKMRAELKQSIQRKYEQLTEEW